MTCCSELSAVCAPACKASSTSDTAESARMMLRMRSPAQCVTNSFVESAADLREFLALCARPQTMRHDDDVLRLVDLDRLAEDAARAEVARPDEPPLVTVARHRRRRR